MKHTSLAAVEPAFALSRGRAALAQRQHQNRQGAGSQSNQSAAMQMMGTMMDGGSFSTSQC